MQVILFLVVTMAIAFGASALTKEMAAALSMFGSDADHTVMAKLCERLAGAQLG
jgi:hypothetical protein